MLDFITGLRDRLILRSGCKPSTVQLRVVDTSIAVDAGTRHPNETARMLDLTDLPRSWNGDNAHAEFILLLDAMQQIAGQKQAAYGYGRLQVRGADYDVKMLYSDLYRKFIRLENATWNAEPNDWITDTNAVEQRMEDLLDLGVYCLRGIQILVRLQRTLEDKERTK